MCGRYASSRSTAEIVEEFHVAEVPEPLPGPRYNIAPTNPVAAVVERLGDNGARVRKAVPLRWGLVPSWAKQPTSSMINARGETVAEKPAFRKAFVARRCLLPADGYYEWYTSPVSGPSGKPSKQPFFIHPEQGSLAMAGIFEFWKQPDGAWLSSCAIITTQATDATGHIHDRMPMTVTDRDAWLDPTLDDRAEIQSLLIPPEVTAYAVSKAVGNVRNEGPQLVEPLPLEG